MKPAPRRGVDTEHDGRWPGTAARGEGRLWHRLAWGAMRPINSEIEQWLRRFAQAVRERDIDAGRELCDERIVSFGTAGVVLDGLDDLVDRQWREIWMTTRGFDFVYDTAMACDLDEAVVAITRWRSSGFDDAGEPFPRSGRATIVLRRQDEGWQAIHTHFSIDPN